MCLRLLTDVIIMVVKMRIITFIYLTVAYIWLVGDAMRIRDNFNVLIPNNNVNRHEKLKEIFKEDDIDPNELANRNYVNDPLRGKIARHKYAPLIQSIRSPIEQANVKEMSYGNDYGYETNSPIIESSEEVNENDKVLPLNQAECLLGKVSETLKWVNENGSLQEAAILENEYMQKLQFLDLSRMISLEAFRLKNIGILSMAFNDLKTLPDGVIDSSRVELQYLSLMGNNFRDYASSINLPNLLELDLRSCNLKTICSEMFQKMRKLKYLYLSNNNIATLDDFSFDLPSLVHLDLSINQEKVKNGDLPNPLKMTSKVFDKLINLRFFDMSHTKIEAKSIPHLNTLSPTLIGISLCYTELCMSGTNFLSNLTNLKFLDVSGNAQLNFTKTSFSTISSTLEVLDVRNSNIEQLDWTKSLTNLRSLNLKDNKIRYVDNNSFSHMLYLKDLNLEKNSVGNWYTRLFTQNQELETLNLRENTLTMLTDDMMEDLLSVRHLALGKNKFECSCSFHDFMLVLFEATRNANVTQLHNRFNLDYMKMESSVAIESINTRPEYDLISRTYEKYFSEILKSIEALKQNNNMRKSKTLISMSDYKRLNNDSVFHTIILDYDVKNEDYECMNVTEKQKQSMLDLIDLCDESSLTKEPPYMSIDDIVIITLSTSIPLVIVFCLLLFLIYWKWWYIRYFFILCKNSAILTFMDDDNCDGKEAIVDKRMSTTSLDIFLYDVFVSYSDYNRSWVLDEFIPNIEKRESINVCLHERDFTVGFGILENITSCMDRSRCLLLLVSEKFLESQWCQFEMNLAQHRLLETRKEKLILVFLEDIPVKCQPKTLRYLMRTKTYIKWPESGSNDEKQLFWKRLKKSIISTKWEVDGYGSIV